MKKYFLLLIAIFSLFSFSNNVQALEIADKPADTLIYDPYNYISFETEDKINKLNEELDLSEEHFQIGVYIIDSLENNSIEEVSLNVARKWEIGGSTTNNGALLVIAINDREFRIETSDNVAIKITDSIANEILNNSKGFFREENYDEGVYSIIENMSSYYSKGTITNYYNSNNEEGVFPLLVILLWLFIFWIIGFIIDLFIKRIPFYKVFPHFFGSYLPRTLMTILRIIILLSDTTDYSGGGSSNRNSGSNRSSGGGGFSGGGSSGSW